MIPAFVLVLAFGSAGVFVFFVVIDDFAGLGVDFDVLVADLDDED